VVSLLRLVPAAVVIFLTVWGAVKMTTKIDARRVWEKGEPEERT